MRCWPRLFALTKIVKVKGPDDATQLVLCEVRVSR